MKFNILLLFTLLIVLKAHAGWKLLGLEKDTILCISMDKSGNIIAGTKSDGIKIYDGKEWLTIKTLSIPVNDVLFTSETRFITAIGNGSNSDGVYSADTIYNPPYYKLSDMPFYGLMSPQSLAKTENNDTIYLGGRNTIVLGRLDSVSSDYTGFTVLKTPANPFGIEKPKCAALHIFKDEGNRLYAGGFDESPEPGEGHLLWMFSSKDSMLINSTINVTSITEAFRDDMGELVIVGTKDSVIYYRNINMSAPIAELVKSPNNEPVNDMITRVYQAVMASLVCVAVESGVYAAAPITSNWFKVDSIPATPLCLAGLSIDDDGKILSLYAGTDRGVFKYDTSTVPIINKNAKNIVNIVSVQMYGENSISLLFTLNKPENVSIDMYNSNGRKISTIFNGYLQSGKHTIKCETNTERNNHMGNGICILRLCTKNSSIFKKLLVLK